MPALRREVGCCDCSSLFCGAGLECLSVGGLAELADELQRCVHEYSEELVSELARRDELDFEKELKNQFIATAGSLKNQFISRASSLTRNSRTSSSQEPVHYHSWLAQEPVHFTSQFIDRNSRISSSQEPVHHHSWLALEPVHLKNQFISGASS